MESDSYGGADYIFSQKSLRELIVWLEDTEAHIVPNRANASTLDGLEERIIEEICSRDPDARRGRPDKPGTAICL